MNLSSMAGGVMSMFNRAPQVQTPAAQPAPTEAGQQQSPANPSLTLDKVPADPAAASQAGLDKFNDLWKKPEVDPNAPKPFDPNNIFNIDPAKMQEAVGQINFAELVTPDDLAAITAGGEGAMAAFAKVLNATSAKTMTLATTASAKMIEQAIGQSAGALDAKVNKQVRLNQVNQELNPALSHPAAAPIVQALTQQISDKYPTASPGEVAGMVKEMMVGFTDIAAGKQETPEDAAAKKATDWTQYLQS